MNEFLCRLTQLHDEIRNLVVNFALFLTRTLFYFWTPLEFT